MANQSRLGAITTIEAMVPFLLTPEVNVIAAITLSFRQIFKKPGLSALRLFEASLFTVISVLLVTLVMVFKGICDIPCDDRISWSINNYFLWSKYLYNSLNLSGRWFSASLQDCVRLTGTVLPKTHNMKSLLQVQSLCRYLGWFTCLLIWNPC